MSLISRLFQFKNSGSPVEVIHDIPRVIHRTLLWDKEIPGEARAGYEAFHKANPGWFVRLWRDDDVRKLADSLGWLQVYDRYEKRIQRADFARYLIILAHGGCYADFDIGVSSRGFLDKSANLISKEGKDSGVVVEACFPEIKKYPRFRPFCPKPEVQVNDLMPIRNGEPEVPLRVANYFLIARPESAFIRSTVDLAIQRSHLRVNLDYDVLYTTGPDVVSEVVFRDPDLVAFLDRRAIKHGSHSSWRNQNV